MEYIRIENEEIKYVNLPKGYNGVENIEFGYQNRTDLHVKDGFLKVIKPEKKENERYLPLSIEDCDLENGTAKYRVEIIPEPTAQELYDTLMVEGKQVFEDFRNELAKAASPYTILDNIPNELKGLTQAMLDAKKRINDALDYLLAQNDVETLKKFSFDTEEARQLKEAIESFK